MYHLDIFVADIDRPFRLEFRKCDDAHRMAELITSAATAKDIPEPMIDDDGTRVWFRMSDLRGLRVSRGD